MLAVIGSLSGVIIGFLLVVARDALRDRRASRTSARLVFFELAENMANLRHLAEAGEWVGFKRSQWESHAAALAPTVNAETVRFLAYVYSRLS